jgi:hypothetical protein
MNPSSDHLLATTKAAEECWVRWHTQAVAAVEQRVVEVPEVVAHRP